MSTKEATFKPERKKIIVKPIMRVRNPLVSDPEHEAYFLFGSASNTYSLPIDKYGNLLNPFTSKEEQEWLEKELDLDLNYHKAKDNFWHKYRVRLDKYPKNYELSNPKQYLEYLILKANSLFIAPSTDEMNNKKTYRYVITSEEQDIKNDSIAGNLKMEAYIAYGKIREDRSEMLNFLKVYGKKVSDVSKVEFLNAELVKIIESDTEGFLAIWNDKDNYSIKLLITEAVDCGAIIKKGREFILPGGDPLCNVGDTAILKNAVEYLQSPKNQEILTLITTRVKTAKSK